MRAGEMWIRYTKNPCVRLFGSGVFCFGGMVPFGAWVPGETYEAEISHANVNAIEELG